MLSDDDFAKTAETTLGLILRGKLDQAIALVAAPLIGGQLLGPAGVLVGNLIAKFVVDAANERLKEQQREEDAQFLAAFVVQEALKALRARDMQNFESLTCPAQPGSAERARYDRDFARMRQRLESSGLGAVEPQNAPAVPAPQPPAERAMSVLERLRAASALRSPEPVPKREPSALPASAFERLLAGLRAAPRAMSPEELVAQLRAANEAAPNAPATRGGVRPVRRDAVELDDE